MTQSAAKHWLILRFTALPLAPLFVYFVLQAPRLTSASRADFLAWLREPTPAVLVPVFIVCAFYHAHLGVQEIVEDYASGGMKKSLLALNAIFFLVVTALSAFTLYRINIG